jgi:glyoxylase-like metal-dependent hydrolase (beta-lactamase superfamily II)
MATLPVVDPWFARRRIDDTITLLWEPHVDPLIRCNIWHVRGRDRDLLVDTGLGVGGLHAAAEDLLDRAVVAVATHSHYDHVGSMHEFDVRVAHPAEAEVLAAGTPRAPLRRADIPPRLLEAIEVAYPLGELLVTAVPSASFDPARFAQPPAAPTWLVEEGDVVDLGDRAFEVLHLPGHSPGSIGLWDATTGTLFSGDAVYDGPLLDQLPGADIAAYVATMGRLMALPVDVVHAGHDPSFGRARLVELCAAYLARRGQPPR